MDQAPLTVPAGTGARGAARAAAIVTVLLIATTGVALAVAPATFLFPFVASKVLFLRPLAWAMAAVLAAEAILRRRVPRRPGAVTWAGLAFLVSAALSTVAGTDPARGLWDTGERMIGVVTFASIACCYAAAVRIGRDGRTSGSGAAAASAASWTVLSRAALVVACLVAAGAVVEMSGALGGRRPDRAGSTLGSHAFLGPFGVHAVFLGVLVLARRPGRGDRALACAAIAGGLVSLALSQARAPVVGLALGAGHLAVRAAIDGTPRVRRAVVVGGAALLALVVAVVLLRDAPAVQSIPLVRRLALWSPSDATTTTRLLAWDVALDAARDRPLLGWGPNAFSHAFAAHFRPEFLRFGEHEVHFDDAHGTLFTTLAEQGLVGVAALAFVYVAALAALRRARIAGALPPFASAAAGAWLIAHAGNLLFSFEDVTSLVCLALVLAWCETAGGAAVGPSAIPGTAPPQPPAGRWRVVAALLCAAAAVGWTLFADVRPAVANARALQAMRLVRRDPRAAVERMASSLALASPHAVTDASLFAWEAQQVLGWFVGAGRADEADLLGRRAFEFLGTAAGPAAANPPRQVQWVLLRAALAEQTPALRNDPAAQDAVHAELRAAVAVAPRRQDLRFALAAAEMSRGGFQEAAEHVQAVLRDDPQSGWGWARLAVIYQRAGRTEDARRIVREARERGVQFRAEDRALLGPLAE